MSLQDQISKIQSNDKIDSKTKDDLLLALKQQLQELQAQRAQKTVLLS